MPKILLATLLFTFIEAKNIGHRLGGDLFSPENTLYAYAKLLPLMHKVDYIEFDIRESKDNQLVVFHDQTLDRIVPKTQVNTRLLKRDNFKKSKIENFTAKELTQLILPHQAHIPTLTEVLDASVEWNVSKPIHIEIKSLHSDIARYKLIQTVANYKHKLDISFIIFSKNFSKAFPFSKRWIALMQKHKLKMFQIDRYDLSKTSNSHTNMLQYKTIMSEQLFTIKSKEKRELVYSFLVPKEIQSLLIGIYHGKDNSGDGGIKVKILNPKEQQLLSVFSNQRYWEWFSVKDFKSRKLKLVLQDKDTKLAGTYPGNAGKIKIIGIQRTQ